MIKRSVKSELEGLVYDLVLNLENNYKDLAHEALNKLHTTLDDYLQKGLLKEKDYRKYKQIADYYSAKLVDYHH